MEETEYLYYVSKNSQKVERLKKMGGFFRNQKKFYWLEDQHGEMIRISADPDAYSGVFETHEEAENYLYTKLKTDDIT